MYSRKIVRNDVNWSLVATSLLGNCVCQTSGKKDIWQEQNRTPLAILARQNYELASLAAFVVIVKKVFVELAGAGAIGKALSFFQILNESKNSRLDRSRIIWLKNMNGFLYIKVFCQHFVKNWRGEKSAVKVT